MRVLILSCGTGGGHNAKCDEGSVRGAWSRGMDFTKFFIKMISQDDIKSGSHTAK